MRSLFKKSFDFCALQLRLFSPGIASKIHAFNGSADDFGRSNGGIVLRDTGLMVDGENASFLAQAGANMRALSAARGARWKAVEKGGFETRLSDLYFEISSPEDVFVLSEVFGLGVYALAYPATAIVIDIGANIGASALFFASKPWVKHVYAFEPLKPTAQIARRNFDRNPAVKNKITLAEYGLGAKDEILTVEYSPEWKGKSGRETLPTDLPRTVKSWSEKIELRDAAKALSGILDSAADSAVVVKMDCEGGEWKILPELARAGLLKRINYMIFEWHDRTPEPLEQLLVENGFTTLRHIDAMNSQIGLVSATNVRATHNGF